MSGGTGCSHTVGVLAGCSEALRKLFQDLFYGFGVVQFLKLDSFIFGGTHYCHFLLGINAGRDQ